MHSFALACGVRYPSRLFWCEVLSFGDVCLPSNIIEQDGTQFVVLEKAPKNTFEKLDIKVSFQKLRPGLLKIMHRLFAEQFHVGTVLSLRHYAERSTHQW